MIKNSCNALYRDDGILLFDEDSGDITFCCNEMAIISVSFNDINYDNNFDKYDPGTIIVISLLDWCSKFKKCNARNATYSFSCLLF